MKKKMILLVTISVLFDRLLKWLITVNLPLYSSVEIIPNFFYLTNVHNVGAGWSILAGYRIVLIVIGITVLVALYYLFIKNKKLTLFETLSYGILAAGILGNLIDRILWGYVIDYLHFHIFGYDFPIFNLADIMIVLSVVAITIKSIEVDYRCKRLK